MLVIHESTKPSELYLTLLADLRLLSRLKRDEMVATLEVFAADYRRGVFQVSNAERPSPVVVVGPCPACGTISTLDLQWGLCPTCLSERNERSTIV